jgi:hypothetical protein
MGCSTQDLPAQCNPTEIDLDIRNTGNLLPISMLVCELIPDQDPNFKVHGLNCDL